MQNKEEYSSNYKKEFYSFLLVSDQLIILTVTSWGHKSSVFPVGIVAVNCEPACIMWFQSTHETKRLQTMKYKVKPYFFIPNEIILMTCCSTAESYSFTQLC